MEEHTVDARADLPAEVVALQTIAAEARVRVAAFQAGAEDRKSRLKKAIDDLNRASAGRISP